MDSGFCISASSHSTVLSGGFLSPLSRMNKPTCIQFFKATDSSVSFKNHLTHQNVVFTSIATHKLHLCTATVDSTSNIF